MKCKHNYLDDIFGKSILCSKCGHIRKIKIKNYNETLNKMTKQELRIFYDALHARLAAKYKLLPGQIDYLRGRFLHEHLDIYDVISKLAETASLSWRRNKKVGRLHSRKFYADLIHFLRKATCNQLEDILQLTEYDKPQTT